jgi:hypothetical protein
MNPPLGSYNCQLFYEYSAESLKGSHRMRDGWIFFSHFFKDLMGLDGQYYRETWPGSSLSSRRAPRQTCHRRGTNLRPPAPQADDLPKELSRQLISWLFGTSTWPEAGAAFGPLHGRPSACGVTHGLKLGCRPNSPCKCGKPWTSCKSACFESRRVTTIERLDQGHLYPLGKRRDKHVTGGAPPPCTAGGRST